MKMLTLAAFADEASPDISKQIEAVKRSGIRHIELRGVGEKNCADLKPQEASELKKVLDDADVRVLTVGSPIGKVPVAANPQEELDRFLRVTETAAILGAEKIRIFSFFRDKNFSEEEGQERALTRLRSFAARADGLMLCHENEKDIYGDNPAFCRRISQEIPTIRAVFDPANYLQCGVDPLTAWDVMAPFVAYLHLKDTDADGVVVPCGMGIGHVETILEKYLAAGGRFATVEPHLFDFAAKKGLEDPKYKTCGYRFDTADAAFDAAMDAVRKLLNGKAELR